MRHGAAQAVPGPVAAPRAGQREPAASAAPDPRANAWLRVAAAGPAPRAGQREPAASAAPGPRANARLRSAAAGPAPHAAREFDALARRADRPRAALAPSDRSGLVRRAARLRATTVFASPTPAMSGATTSASRGLTLSQRASARAMAPSRQAVAGPSIRAAVLRSDHVRTGACAARSVDACGARCRRSVGRQRRRWLGRRRPS